MKNFSIRWFSIGILILFGLFQHALYTSWTKDRLNFEPTIVDSSMPISPFTAVLEERTYSPLPFNLRWYGNFGYNFLNPTAFRMPGYAFFQIFTGTRIMTLGVQIGLYLLAGILIFWYAGTQGIPREKALSRSLYYLAFPPFALYPYLFQPDSLQISLFTTGFILCLSRKYGWATLALAPCATMKEGAAIYIGALAIFCIWRETKNWWQEDHVPRTLLKKLFVCGVPFAISALFPLGWGVRNVRLGYPFMGTNGIFNLYVGNNEEIGKRIATGQAYFFNWGKDNEDLNKVRYPREELAFCLKWQEKAIKWRAEQSFGTHLKLIRNKTIASFQFLNEMRFLSWRKPHQPTQLPEPKRLLQLWLLTCAVFIVLFIGRAFYAFPYWGATQKGAVLVSVIFFLPLLYWFPMGRLMLPIMGIWGPAIATNHPARTPEGKIFRVITMLVGMAFAIAGMSLMCRGDCDLLTLLYSYEGISRGAPLW